MRVSHRETGAPWAHSCSRAKALAGGYFVGQSCGGDWEPRLQQHCLYWVNLSDLEL